MNNFTIAFGILLSIAFICLVFIFCLGLIKLYIQKIKAHNQKEIAFQKELNNAIIETQEQVLNNISQDLHDDAGQQLTYINFQLEHLKLDAPELESTLAPVSQTVRELSNSIRSISHSLNNQLIVQQDIIKAIANEVERLKKNKRIDVVFNQIPNAKKQFSINEKMMIYRIFQEIINNSLKHAQATKITIKVKVQPFELEVSDNGKGFDLNLIDKKLTLGLQSMNNRAEIINYSLNYTSVVGQGTTFLLAENPTV